MLVGNIHQILFFLCQLYYSILGYSLHSIVPSLFFSVCMLLSFMLCLCICVLCYLCRTIALVVTVICWLYPTLNKFYLILSYLILENVKGPRHCPLWRESPADSPHKGLVTRKSFGADWDNNQRLSPYSAICYWLRLTHWCRGKIGAILQTTF